MKRFSSIWLIVSLFVLPCSIDTENIWCLLAMLASLILSFLTFKKYNPEYVLTNK